MELIFVIVAANLIFKTLKGKAKGKGKNTAGLFFLKGLSKFAFVFVIYVVFVALHTF